jgi:hypothetical protein
LLTLAFLAAITSLVFDSAVTVMKGVLLETGFRASGHRLNVLVGYHRAVALAVHFFERGAAIRSIVVGERQVAAADCG